jgi:HD-like signal output (HDOD) protein
MSESATVSEILTKMELIKGFPDTVCQDLAVQAKLIRLEGDRRLLRGQIRDQRLFLVDGNVHRSSNGLERDLDSCLGLSEPVELFEETGSDQDTVLTEGPCLFLALPAAAVKRAQTQAAEVDDIELDEASGDFLEELYERIMSNSLELPAHPEVALRIQQLTSDPDVGMPELTELIQSDAILAGALLHASNSASLRGTQAITSVRDAVVRIGFANTRMLATNLALRQVFKAKHAVAREAMTQVWMDSVLRSAFSYLLSKNLNLLNPDRALLAGLLASVGAVPIIQFFDQRSDEIIERKDLEQRVTELLGVTGVLVINYWELGEDLVKVAEHGTNWSYQASEPDYASLSLVARWAALAHHEQPRPPATEVPAFKALGMQVPDMDGGIAELEGSKAAFEYLQSMFAA